MDTAHQILHLIAKIFDAIWSYNLIVVSGNSIRVANIVFAIIMFLIGFKYSRNVATIIKAYVRNKLEADKDAANCIEKLVLYLLFCLYIITILEISNIPLSTFAFIGGALAIGIGLGAQTMISNFLNGLNIMIEKPLKIGDIVEMEGVTGTVTSVGARCVVITTFTNVEVLIPNTKLMQNTLVNWTLSDNFVKYKIEIVLDANKLKNFHPREFITELSEIASNFSFLPHDVTPDVSFYKINSESLRFLLLIPCSTDTLKNPELVKNEVNLALFDHFKDYEMSVNYHKLAEVKPVDKPEK